jgi:hypothetical protein
LPIGFGKGCVESNNELLHDKNWLNKITLECKEYTCKKRVNLYK